jgi:hypothetical protein
MPPRVDLGLNAVIVAVTEEVPRILTIRRTPPSGGPPEDALPFGPLDPDLDRTLDRGLRRWVAEQTGLPLGYVEQLYTFGDRSRDPAESHGGPRLVSVAYLALVREASVEGAASWRGWYEFFPWEDWRQGRPEILDRDIAPALEAWIEAADSHRPERRERAEIAFGLGGVQWDPDRVLERYELLYEARLVYEARRDRRERAERGEGASSDAGLLPGRPMTLDHRRILATALGRLRGKIRYRPVVFELLPPTFTLLLLQKVVEALTGFPLHKQNFRRLVEHGGLVEGTGQDVQTGGRPAELFRFRRGVLRERPAPGVGPGVRR